MGCIWVVYGPSLHYLAYTHMSLTLGVASAPKYRPTFVGFTAPKYRPHKRGGVWDCIYVICPEVCSQPTNLLGGSGM